MKIDIVKKNKAAQVGLVLGVVFVIMGFAYGNSGVWMLGFIFLAIGIFARAKK
jgi:hypothetical protein